MQLGRAYEHIASLGRSCDIHESGAEMGSGRSMRLRGDEKVHSRKVQFGVPFS
jgi:hypothetical protein